MPLNRQQTLVNGNGNLAAAGQYVRIHCVCYGADNAEQQLWSSRVGHPPGTRAKPLVFRIGEGTVIRGLNDAVMQMRVGEQARFECSSDLALSDVGHNPWNIPPNTDLVLDVELVGIFGQNL